uniref:Phosphatidylinositol transfer protein N-terminal domain-containing protein n=1 Tax=Poecilia reticulata TaxID=8081 RepID=A0A3P9MSJ8_POERE
CGTLKENRLIAVCMFAYRIGQLYMISKHSHEQSDRGEGVEVVQNEPFEDPVHGQGQFTEKRVYLNRSVPLGSTHREELDVFGGFWDFLGGFGKSYFFLGKVQRTPQAIWI